MTYCSSCGSAVEGQFCPKCGTAIGAGPADQTGAGAAPAAALAAPGMQENMASALCYLLTVVTGILFLVLEPYNRNKNIRFHAFQAIFFFAGTIVLWIGLFIVSMVLHVLPVIGAILSFLLGIGVWLGMIVVWIMLMYKAYNGQRMVLPIIGPLAEKQA